MARKFCLTFSIIVVLTGLTVGCTPTVFDCEKYIVELTCGERTGVGFFTDAGYILTAAHIIVSTLDEPKICSVTDRNGHTYSAEIISIDEAHDLAAIKSHISDGIRTDGEMKSGRLAVTGPRGTYVTTLTTVKKCSVHGKPSELIELNIHVEKGMSGAPVTDGRGCLVGLICARDTVGKHSYAVPINEVKAFLATLP